MSGSQEKDKAAVINTERRVNDFSMTVATVNGSGSQTSNLTLIRALFKMGIPVSGKNLFPSNIQGLPTWFTIRVSKDGYTARSETHEIVVAMNQATIEDDLKKVEPGGVFIYADHLKFEGVRDDIVSYPIPAKELAKESGASPSLRDYVANMAYVGVLVQLLEIDMEKIKMALDFHFGGKASAVDLNFGVIEAAAKWAAENLEKKDPFYVEELNLTEGYVMADGNSAAALGSIFGGVQFCSWYPITPATNLPEALTHYLPVLRDDISKDGKKTYAIVQSEDELAAIGMAIGAAWSGLRSMTSTSGPGISLMSEFIGLAYYSEIPVVVWNVQRVGPSTGLPTRTSQGDVNQAYFLGHGDTKHIVLFPSSVHECFEFGWRAFDIAERTQTPVFVLSDLDLGMNHWMAKEFEYPDVDMDRGKFLWEEELENFGQKWGRYLDVDGDGIPYRTFPGNKHPESAYFARGTGHDEYAAYTEDHVDWEVNMARLVQKFETSKQYLPEPELVGDGKAKLGVIAYGSTEPAILEARDMLKAEGIEIDFLRVRALPLRDEVKEFIASKDRVYVVELNRDGQLHEIIRMDLSYLCEKLVSLPKHDGLSLSASWVFDSIIANERK